MEGDELEVVVVGPKIPDHLIEERQKVIGTKSHWEEEQRAMGRRSNLLDGDERPAIASETGTVTPDHGMS